MIEKLAGTVPRPADCEIAPPFISHTARVLLVPLVLLQKMSLLPSPLKSCVSDARGPTVIRPILPLPSVNHSAPSGPAVINWGLLVAVGTGNSVMTPAVVIRPTLLPTSSVNHSAPSGPAVMP